MAFAGQEFPNADFYKSDLSEIIKYMKEFESKLDSYDEIIAELQAELDNIQGLYTRVDALERATSDLDTIRTKLNDIINLENVHYNELTKAINDIITSYENLEKTIENLKEYVDSNIANLRREKNVDIQNVYKYINSITFDINKEIEIIKEIISRITTEVKNPWRTNLGNISLNRNINYIYNDLADECLTAEQYATLGLTANSYNTYDINARDYSEFGKTKLHFKWVFSPTYGFKQEISNVLTSIINYIKGTITATEYTQLDLDADAYTSLDLTANDYYSYMSNQGYLGLGQTGITAQQYNEIGIVG